MTTTARRGLQDRQDFFASVRRSVGHVGVFSDEALVLGGQMRSRFVGDSEDDTERCCTTLRIV